VRDQAVSSSHYDRLVDLTRKMDLSCAYLKVGRARSDVGVLLSPRFDISRVADRYPSLPLSSISRQPHTSAHRSFLIAPRPFPSVSPTWLPRSGCGRYSTSPPHLHLEVAHTHLPKPRQKMANEEQRRAFESYMGRSGGSTAQGQSQGQPIPQYPGSVAQPGNGNPYLFNVYVRCGSLDEWEVLMIFRSTR
jgi:hypothetical protein